MLKYDSHSKPVSNICKVVSKEDLFKDFRSEGTIALSQNGKPVSVNILRDTGAAQTLLVKKAVPGLSKNYTGEKVFIRDFSNTSSIQLADLYLNCEFVKGKVTVGVIETELPVSGSNMLLGNDLAGKLVLPNLIVTEKPLKETPTVKLESEQPLLFPKCVTTRSKAKNDDNQNDPDNSNFDLGKQPMT